MGLKNKLGVFFIGVHLFIPTIAQALILEPIKIDSSQGDPLYAEIPFHQANSQAPLQVSIAQPFEIGIAQATSPSKLAHFNFYVRQNNQGNGVIVITSNQPINDKNLSLLLKINDSGQVHIQQLRQSLPTRIQRLESSLQEKALQPRIVTDETALALNLPTASNVASQGQSLVIQKVNPPPLKMAQNTAAASTPSQITVVAPAAQAQATANISPTLSQPVTPQKILNATNAEITSNNLSISITRRLPNEPAPLPTYAQQNTPSLETASLKPVDTAKDLPAPKEAKAIAPTANNSHTVMANESLWAIASQIAKTENLAIQDVMKDIHAQNEHAFIHGNANRLKQGAVLNIPSEYKAPIRTENTKQQAQAKQPVSNTTAQAAPTAQKQNQAHMSIVSNDTKGAIQGTNKAGQSTSAQQNELTVQLKKERQSALSLQNSVRQLDQQLQQKETRISLLNAKLAELEQQLKIRKLEQKDQSTKTN